MRKSMTNNVLRLLGVVLFVLLIYLVYTERPGQWATVVAAIGAFLLTRIDDIVRFKMGTSGVEAEMREILTEAKVTIG